MDDLTIKLLYRIGVAGLLAALTAALFVPFAGIFAGSGASLLIGLLIVGLWYDSDLKEQRSQLVRTTQQAETLANKLRQDSDRIIINAFNEPVLILDQALRVVWANAAARTIIAQKLEGEDITVFLRQPIAIDVIQTAQTTGKPTENEIQFFSPVESRFILHAQPLQQGERRILIWMRNITKSYALERMRVDFIANASHELRTPLAILMGFIETLQGPAVDDVKARAHFLDIMSQEASRMTRLVEDLLSLSRIELEKHVKPSTSINLLPVLNTIEQAFAVQLQATHQRLKLHTADSLPDVVADQDQIVQVLHNLVSNAIKYGHKNSDIEITAQFCSDMSPPVIKIAVQDHGDGIAAEYLPRLTERFYRVDTARSREMGGTGLGLAIVKHIIEKHRGQLTIASTVGKGTTVSFTLPVVSA